MIGSNMLPELVTLNTRAPSTPGHRFLSQFSDVRVKCIVLSLDSLYMKQYLLAPMESLVNGVVIKKDVPLSVHPP